MGSSFRSSISSSLVLQRVFCSLSQSPYFVFSFESATGSFCLHHFTKLFLGRAWVQRVISVFVFLSLAGELGTDGDSCFFKYLLCERHVLPILPQLNAHSWVSAAICSSRCRIPNSAVLQGSVIENRSSLFTFAGIYGLMTLKKSPSIVWPLPRSLSSSPSTLCLTLHPQSHRTSYFFSWRNKPELFLRTFYLRFALPGILQTYFFHDFLSCLIQCSPQGSPP